MKRNFQFPIPNSQDTKDTEALGRWELEVGSYRETE
jgi:hypothetical protein